MNNKLEIERIIDDLNKERWVFSLYIDYNGMNLYFDYYGQQSRKTKRHKYTTGKYYDRLIHRCGYNLILQPEIPEGLLKQVKDYYKNAIDNIDIV